MRVPGAPFKPTTSVSSDRSDKTLSTKVKPQLQDFSELLVWVFLSLKTDCEKASVPGGCNLEVKKHMLVGFLLIEIQPVRARVGAFFQPYN